MAEQSLSGALKEIARLRGAMGYIAGIQSYEETQEVAKVARQTLVLAPFEYRISTEAPDAQVDNRPRG